VGLFAPANLPPELVARLNTAVGEALKSPKMLKVLATVGLDAKGGSPAEFKDYLNREVDKWGQVIKETGVEPQ
jgi:tripartite-type tricarboxylate transporter receptor subunit TctC